jgi:Uri superfamily endonuclease
MPFMENKIISNIPAQPGSYVFWLRLPQPQDLVVGRLGSFTFPAGDYLYMGSARGAGGLRARLERHLRGDGKSHWHIDHLRTAAQARGFGFETSSIKECTWSQRLVPLPEACIPVPGFGASDCRSGCSAHLVYLPTLDVNRIVSLLNCEIHILNDE